jgi:hypothetical protein
VLDAEGLHHWEVPHLEGYASLHQAAAGQGLFRRFTQVSA